MAHDSPLVRQWILLKTLSVRHHGVTVQEMAQELAVSEKTVRRDLEAFVLAGFPLEEQVGEHGRKQWRLDPAKYQPGLSFAFDEALALHLAQHLLEPLAGTPFWEAARRAFKKIRSALGDRALKYADRFTPLFHQTTIGTSNYAAKGELIDRLMVGIEDRRAVFITYQSLRATEPVSYDIYPYGLAYHHGSLYLVGWSTDHAAIRHWKVDRIEDVDLTPIPFPWPEGFSLRDHFATSFGVFHGPGDIPVKIRFSPTVARYVQEKHWHATQKLTPQPDGSLVAEFRLGSTEEVKSWVLSFGKEADVLEPEGLREEIADDCTEMLRRYVAARRGPNVSERIRNTAKG
ncbi:MAG: transcriptional regulator [Thermoguttaceae bacterium]